MNTTRESPSVLLMAARASPEDLDPYGAMVATRDMLLYMHENSAGGMFDGTLELMDDEVVKALRDNLDRVTLNVMEGTAPQIDFETLEAEIGDHEIQELAAGIFARAHAQNPLFSDFNESLGQEISADLANIIVDWQTRYQHEEGVEP